MRPGYDSEPPYLGGRGRQTSMSSRLAKDRIPMPGEMVLRHKDWVTSKKPKDWRCKTREVVLPCTHVYTHSLTHSLGNNIHLKSSLMTVKHISGFCEHHQPPTSYLHFLPANTNVSSVSVLLIPCWLDINISLKNKSLPRVSSPTWRRVLKTHNFIAL